MSTIPQIPRYHYQGGKASHVTYEPDPRCVRVAGLTFTQLAERVERALETRSNEIKEAMAHFDRSLRNEDRDQLAYLLDEWEEGSDAS